MNKKIVAMVTSLTVGGSLLFASSLANASQVSGYDALKNALKDTKSLKNETAEVKVYVLDNGNNLLSLSSKLKVALQSDAMSGTATITEGSKTQTISHYRQDGKNITKNNDSDQYLVQDFKGMKFNREEKSVNPTAQKCMEILADTLVGNMKDNVTATNNSDGTKTISINLNENEVSPLVDALTEVAFMGANSHKQELEGKGEFGNLKNVIPGLQSDIKIESVTSTTNVNKEDIITAETAKIVVAGKDATGTQHEVTLNIDASISDISTTTPDKVDLTGKNVKTIQFDMKERRRF